MNLDELITSCLLTKHKTDNVHMYNVILRRVRATIVAVKKQ